jgi:hypothetical protein
MNHSAARRLYRDTPLSAAAYWMMLALTCIALYVSPLHHLEYVVPFIALIVGLADGRFTLGGVNAPFVFLLVTGLALSPQADSDGFKDLYFIWSGVSAALVLQKTPIKPKLFFMVFTGGTVLFAVLFGGLLHGFVFDIALSESSFEGNFGFLFGLLAIYAGMKRQYWICILSVVWAVLALKRIVLVALLACGLAYLLPERIARRVLNPIGMLAINLGVILCIVLYANHQFDWWIAYFTGQSANQLGMGRQELYGAVTHDIFYDPLGHLLLGAGPGAGYEKLAYFGASNLHSDLLKIVFEYGIVIFGAFVWLGYRMRDVRVRIMFLYANILYATDNVLIYHFFLFFLCLFARAIESEPAVARSNVRDQEPEAMHAIS